MTYKEEIGKAMVELASNKDTVFLGEGLINAGRIYGTMDGVDISKCVEFPIAENLIVGCAVGLAIKGYKPVVVFQRMDFMTCACDAIINHLATIPQMSGGRIQLPVILRAIIGSRSDKFEMGLQHSKDLTHMFVPWINTVTLVKGNSPLSAYRATMKTTKPTLIVEDRDLYEDKV